MLDEQIDELGSVLHEVDVLIHGPVHDEQPPLFIRQLSHKVQNGAQLVAIGLAAGTV